MKTTNKHSNAPLPFFCPITTVVPSYHHPTLQMTGSQHGSSHKTFMLQHICRFACPRPIQLHPCSQGLLANQEKAHVVEFVP